ncbi:MAG: NAD+ synthase [Waddliaceae bacterium]
MRAVLTQMNPTIGDLQGNVDKILKGIAFAKRNRAELVLFPELAITGYPPEDILLLPHFIEAAESALDHVVMASRGITVIVGIPRYSPVGKEKRLYNSAAVISDGTIIGFQDKMLLPTYNVFDENRYFSPGDSVRLWEINGTKVAITICEDIWQHAEAVCETRYINDPIKEYKELKPDLLINISASPYHLNKFQDRLKVSKRAVETLHCPYLFCNQVGANDSLIFDGRSFCLDKEGKLIDFAPGFVEDHLIVDIEMNHVVKNYDPDPIEELYKALVLGIKDYFHKSGFKKACLGLSGGIDSAVVAALASEALGKENVLAVMMPSRYTSHASERDAKKLLSKLQIPSETVSIENIFQSFLDELSPFFKGKEKDATEENLQSRIRGMILMAFSNKHGHIVLSTGNKSEMAMGYSTLYGDMTGGLGVLNDVTKQQVYFLAEYINRNQSIIPKNIIKKAPTAELRANQKDSDTLPDYKIIDTVVEEYVENHLSPQKIAENYGYPKQLVDDLVKRIHLNEYKRRQSPPGLRVSKRAFSVGRRFPIVQGWT